MSKDRRIPPKEPPPPRKGAAGPLLCVILGVAVGVALVVGFLHLRNKGTFDEWIEKHSFLNFLDDD